MDNPNKKKLDAKRIALGQRHEVQYLRRRAEQLIKFCEWDMKECGQRSSVNLLQTKGSGIKVHHFPVQTLHRLARALLKATSKPCIRRSY